MTAELQKFVSLQQPKVQKNVSIVTPETLGQDFFLYIGGKIPKTFTPMMPKSAGGSENNQVPRITVSDSLIGCVVGYARVEDDVIYKEFHGYYLVKFPFEAALKPTPAMVYDADESNEHWLVTYDTKTIRYTPTHIGKVFVHRYINTVIDKELINNELLELYLEINTDDMVRINDKVSVSKGYYKVLLSCYLRDPNKIRLHNYTLEECKKISSQEYFKAKQLSASMLDVTSVNIPLSLKWG